MTRGVRLCLVGSLVVVALAGCGRYFFAEREPWRREAEVQCLKSGAVKESPAIVRATRIDGPGMCGAEFPLKVAALGDSGAFGYADELRPPAAIPNVGPRWPLAQPNYEPRYAPPPEPRYAPPPGQPLSLNPRDLLASREQPTFSPPPPHDRAPYRGPTYESRAYPPPQPAYETRAPAYPPPPPPRAYPDRPDYAAPRAYPPAAPQTIPLGPVRAPMVTRAVGPAVVKPAATLACPVVSALEQWMTASVQPSAQRWFGQPVAEIRQISAYSCRGMNGQPGARISEHSFGNALDIAAFTLADGRTITVKDGWRGLPEEQGFLRDIQAAACEQFTTVLAPGSNRFHYDHMHVDLMRRPSGHRICNPDAVSGEEVAARAAQRRYAHGDRGVTGSLAPRGQPRRPAVQDEDDWIEDDPNAR